MKTNDTLPAQRVLPDRGFTLVELLIVVIILAVLAAIVVPQFSAATEDAKLAALETNLRSLRSAISRYTADHGHYPGATPSVGICAVGTITATATPGAAAFVAQMTKFTTASGVACSQKDGHSGGEIKYGPYLKRTTLPVNPMTSVSVIVAIHTGSLTMTGSGSDNDGGWLYDIIVGKIIADQPSYDHL